MTDYSDLPDEMSLEEFLELFPKGVPELANKTRSGRGRIRKGGGKAQSDKQAEEIRRLHLVAQFTDAGLPIPIHEFQFHPTRKWRFDIAWPDYMVALEIDGGVYSRPVTCDKCGSPVERRLKNGRTVRIREGGRHNTGEGYEKDCEKFAEAAIHGWRVVRASSSMVDDGRALQWIKKIIRGIH